MKYQNAIIVKHYVNFYGYGSFKVCFVKCQVKRDTDLGYAHALGSVFVHVTQVDINCAVFVGSVFLMHFSK